MLPRCRAAVPRAVWLQDAPIARCADLAVDPVAVPSSALITVPAAVPAQQDAAVADASAEAFDEGYPHW